MWEFAQPIYKRFGNLEKAFNRVPREIQFWGVLWEYGVSGPPDRGCMTGVRLVFIAGSKLDSTIVYNLYGYKQW